ncbi:MAG: hypothetical protein WCW27_02025 [Patescibacteria group bacterium]|jgi:hypothetical protein
MLFYGLIAGILAKAESTVLTYGAMIIAMLLVPAGVGFFMLRKIKSHRFWQLIISLIIYGATQCVLAYVLNLWPILSLIIIPNLILASLGSLFSLRYNALATVHQPVKIINKKTNPIITSSLIISLVIGGLYIILAWWDPADNRWFWPFIILTPSLVFQAGSLVMSRILALLIIPYLFILIAGTRWCHVRIKQTTVPLQRLKYRLLMFGLIGLYIIEKVIFIINIIPE